jgi:tryptophan 2,3-dioxygenase
VNAYEQLLAIRDRLEHIGGNEASIDLVDKFLARAESERNSQTSVPQVMMLRHLLRQREALDNDAIYNDLQELMDDFDKRHTAEDDVRPAYEDSERHPRPRSFYKALKEKEQQKKP